MKYANFPRARVRFIKYVHLFPKKLHRSIYILRNGKKLSIFYEIY